MECVICKKGETSTGKTTVTLERGSTLLVVKGVPAQVCDNCGEEYVSESVTESLLQLAEKSSQSGVQVDVREFVAA